MFKKVFWILTLALVAAGCSSPKTKSAQHKKNTQKKYTYKSKYSDPSKQDAVEDLIYSELSKSQKAILKKYKSSSDHSLGSAKFDIPMTRNDAVERWIEYFAYGSGRKHFERWLGRSTRFVPTQLKALKAQGIPKDIIFLSMIESGFNTHAFSSAAASGLWQFIKSTGRLYGLESDSWIDERRDPEKASLAAARHLRDLYDDFGDWYLAFAAYNAGAGKVRRAIAGTGSRDFWDLANSSYLRQETKDYVPKILAAATIGKSLEKYGFDNIEFQDPIATEKARVSSPTDLETIAQCAGVDTDLVRLLNPELIRNMTPPDMPNYEINLPRGTKRQFETRYARLDRSDRLKNITYTAQSGDNLRSIAAENGVSLNALVNANPQLGDRSYISSGTKIIVPQSYTSAPTMVLASSSFATPRGNRLIDLIAERNHDDGSKNKKSKRRELKESTFEPKEKTDGREDLKVVAKEKSNTDLENTAVPTVNLEKEALKTNVAINEKANNELGVAPDNSNSAPPTQPIPSNEEKIDNSLRAIAASAVDATPPTANGVIPVKSSGEEVKINPKRAITTYRVTPREKLPVTQEKTVAKSAVHRVKRGESLTEIASNYGVSVAELKEWNKISKKGLLADQKLVIRPQTSNPKTAKTPEKAAPNKTKAPLSKTQSAPAKSEKVKTITYKVRKGDTLEKIAERHDISISEIRKLNGLGKKSLSLKPGYVLKIRSGKSA